MNSIWRETWLARLQHEGHYTNMSTHRRAVRRLNEILFSMNIGFAIALLLRNHFSHFGPGQSAFDDFAVRMIVICFLLFSLGKWHVPEWCTAILLVLHYAIWFWVVWQLYYPIPEAIFVSALPPCGCLAWILYARKEQAALTSGLA
jgi:hypothetical protein